MREIKKTTKKARIDPTMRDEDDFDLEEPQMASRSVRLSELDCASLSLEELDIIDRSQNYILPNSARQRVQDYRKVYAIPDPESERLERLQAEREWREKLMKYQQAQQTPKTEQVASQPLPPNQANKEPSLDSQIFDFDRKFNGSESSQPTK